MQCLKHSMAFITQITKVQNPPNKHIVRPITAILQDQNQLPIVSEIQFIITMMGSTLTCRQMWCLSWRSEIWLTNLVVSWAPWTLKPALIVTHFLQQGHYTSNKVKLPNNATTYEIIGANNIYTTILCKSNVLFIEYNFFYNYSLIFPPGIASNVLRVLWEFRDFGRLEGSTGDRFLAMMQHKKKLHYVAVKT